MHRLRVNGAKHRTFNVPFARHEPKTTDERYRPDYPGQQMRPPKQTKQTRQNDISSFANDAESAERQNRADPPRACRAPKITSANQTHTTNTVPATFQTECRPKPPEQTACEPKSDFRLTIRPAARGRSRA